MPDAGGGPAGSPPPRTEGAGGGRSPGWREVLVVAALVLGAVFAVEIASSLLPPLREAFRGFPLTIVVLVAGTAGLLLVLGLRRPRA